MLRRIRDFFRRDSGDGAFPVPSTLVVGLGNPGPQYASTRHNIGFRVVETLAERHGGIWVDDPASQSRLSIVEIADRTVALMAPQAFMNRSGESVVAALVRWPAIDPSTGLIIVYDDLDLPTGRIRLRPEGGAGGHNGIGDILERLGSKSVPRLRFGIGHPGSAGAVIDWVLNPFSDTEEEGLLPHAIDWAADCIEAAIAEGVRSAMGRFNAKRVE
jgi:PTH1 family peptidyl-tRNA hydrolase